MKNFLKYVLNLWRCFFANLILLFCGKKTRKLIMQDLKAFIKGYKIKHSLLFYYNLKMQNDLAFRAVLFLRVKRKLPILYFLNNIFLPRPKTIEIDGEFGGGLRLSHYYMVVSVKTAGENFRVGPGVVVGQNNGKVPTIGNNVYIASNSVVIGDIKIGDNVIIGAGSVVTKDVPDNCVYAGNPARFVRNVEKRDECNIDVSFLNQ